MAYQVHSGMIFIVIVDCNFRFIFFLDELLANKYGRWFGEDVQQFPLTYLNYLEEKNPSCSPEPSTVLEEMGYIKFN
jgi:hypothetical protein